MNRWQIFSLVLTAMSFADLIYVYVATSVPWWEPVTIIEIVTYALFDSTTIEMD